MYTHSKIEMRTRVFKDKTLQHSHETVNVRGVYSCEKVVSNLREERKLQLSERKVLRNNWMQSVMKYKILIKLKHQVFKFNVSHPDVFIYTHIVQRISQTQQFYYINCYFM